MPTEQEKNRSIDFILTEGLAQPQDLGRSLLELWHSIGLRGLFFGVENSSFLAVLVTLLAASPVLMRCKVFPERHEAVLFAVSPFLYASVQVLNTWKDYLTGTYEQKMTCRYSLYQVNALRMLVFGGISVVLSVALCGGLCLYLRLDHAFLRLASLSFASLFLFAAAQLAVEWKVRIPVCHFIVPVAWVVVSGALLASESWGARMLMRVPTSVFWLITAGAAVIYAKTIRRYYFSSKEGAVSYAVS